jgi:FlaA1/EpsC-like NDP-sugar epimerase
MKMLLKKTPLTRMIAFLVGDVILLSLSLYLSFLIRFDWNVPAQYMFGLYIPIFIGIRIPVFFFFRLYSMSWSFAGAYELMGVAKGLTLSTLLIALIVYVINPDGIFSGFPRSIVLLDYVLSMFLICSFRFLKRFYLHIAGTPSAQGKQTLLVGAGEAGESLVRDIHRQQESQYSIVGFVDDRHDKKGSSIQGVRVYGASDQIPELADKFQIETILIAIPSATSRDMKRIMDSIRRSSVRDVRIVPGVREIMEGKVALGDVKQVSIEDIIGREQASINYHEIEALIKGKSVLVTGAGGSIGAEIVRQVIHHDPHVVLAFDIDETELFYLEGEIKSVYQGTPYVSIVGDICDANKVDYVFKQYKPHIVLHAAAYKHVPMMEDYPEEAVKVNILGTMNVADAAIRSGCEKFVFISTDKAVTPTSIMGLTKRVAEEVVKFYNVKNHASFLSVRFGNVVGSRGSVIPIFKNQILKGGPITVTHKDMTRYFMSIPEAVALVLQAASMGNGGEVFILDMGEQVRILDVAEYMIRLSGFEPDKDIPIVFTGVRKGEKLHEELLTPLETTERTAHSKIYKARNEVLNNDIIEKVDSLKPFVVNPDKQKIVALLKEIIPTYAPAKS